ncbi:hypothetical protein TSUD_339160 [Trifolium subterraneum]|nr:hypothetical protein TSUD_339160 [Trifolium subterraneum]
MSHFTPIDDDSYEDEHFDEQQEDEHFDERQEKIDDACSLLFELGFDQNVFTIENIYNHGYTDDEFLELIKPLASITDIDDLTYLSHSARQCNVHLPPYDFRSFLDYIKWLNKIDGKRALAVISNRKENLEKKKLTKGEVALAGKFVDYAASRRLDRIGIYSEIEELRSRLKKLEMEYESIDDELKRELGPLYEYKEPELPELRIQAYELYEDDCKSQGLLPIPKHHDMGFEKAMEEFGGIVKESRELVNYLSDPVRQEKVKNFFKGKIIRMDYATDGGETTIVYKFASDVCEEEISNVNVVYKPEEFSNGRKANIIYKFGSDVCKEISNVPPLPNSKRARKRKAKRQKQRGIQRK